MKTDFEFWRPHLRASHVETWKKLRAIFGSKTGIMPGIEWSKRMTKTLALAYMNDPKKPDFIRLSAVQFWNHPEAYVREIIPHELAHIAAFRVFNEDGHGRPWKDVMASIGFENARSIIELETIARHKREFWKDKA